MGILYWAELSPLKAERGNHRPCGSAGRGGRCPRPCGGDSGGPGRALRAGVSPHTKPNTRGGVGLHAAPPVAWSICHVSPGARASCPGEEP